MSRARASVPPEAIRIEDEVWQEAFTRREPSPSRAARRLYALDGGVKEPDRRPARPRRPSGSASPGAPAASEPAPGAQAPNAPAASAPAPAPGDAPARLTGPRTVVIRGRGAEPHTPPLDISRRRAPRRAYERTGFRPDRVAMWAVLLGMLLVLVAVASGHS